MVASFSIARVKCGESGQGSQGVDRRGEAKFLSHQNGVSSLVFLVVRDSISDPMTFLFIVP